ncbi:MAG: hypothetical protein AAGD01_07105 [Acidobacteriota bacterium]
MKSPAEIADFLMQEYWRAYRDSFFFVLLPMLTALALLFFQHQIPLGAALLWASSFLACGVLVGFLFGIPKVSDEQRIITAPAQEAGQTTVLEAAGGEGAAASGRHEAATRYRQVAVSDLRVNTNLERVSDWLTKTLVGVGLIELREIPEGVVKLAEFIAMASGEEPTAMARSVSIAMVLIFCSLGFLAGYINTRLYFSLAFAKADRSLQGFKQGSTGELRVGSGELRGLDDDQKASIHGGDEGREAQKSDQESKE